MTTHTKEIRHAHALVELRFADEEACDRFLYALGKQRKSTVLASWDIFGCDAVAHVRYQARGANMNDIPRRLAAAAKAADAEFEVLHGPVGFSIARPDLEAPDPQPGPVSQPDDAADDADEDDEEYHVWDGERLYGIHVQWAHSERVQRLRPDDRRPGEEMSDRIPLRGTEEQLALLAEALPENATIEGAWLVITDIRPFGDDWNAGYAQYRARVDAVVGAVNERESWPSWR